MATSSTGNLSDALRDLDRRERLFAEVETIVVGVSGGLDSVVMLHLLARYAAERRLRLHVAHLDHRLRPDSAADAAFVDELARELGLPATIGAIEAGQLAMGGRGVEHAARRARYEFLAQVAARTTAGTVAVGHTADDVAETVLMNVLHGAGVDGLAAMPVVSSWPVFGPSDVRPEAPSGPRQNVAPRLVRPLVRAWRSDVLAYAREHDLRWRDDPSNVDDSYLRNRLRHSLIPALEAENPRLRAALVRLARAAADDAALLEALVADAWCQVAAPAPPGQTAIDLARWPTVEPALRRRLLRVAYARTAGGAGDLEWVHVEAMDALAVEGRDGASVHLPHGLEAVRTGAELIVRRRSETPRPSESPVPVTLAMSGPTLLWDGWVVEVHEREATPGDRRIALGDRRIAPDDGRPMPAGGQGEQEPWTARIDPDRLAVQGGSLQARGRRPGERMAPMGMCGRHRTLQDIFVDGHVPRALRARWPVVVDDQGVVWLPGYRIDERASLLPGSVRVWELTARPPAAAAPIGASRRAAPPAR